jgi:flagellar protein FlaF
MSIARYAATQNAAASPREIELRAFRYVNGLLAAADGVPARAEALHKAHRLWTLLLNDLASPGNALPQALRGQLVSLGLWAQREADARLADGGSLEALMALHRDMIAGLEAQRPAPAGASPRVLEPATA